jgi:O-antigen/teichoic acid export membrane protein
MGEIAIVTNSISLLIPILTIGYSTGIMRYMLDKDKDENRILGALIFIWIIANFILITFYPLLNKFSVFEGYLKYFYSIFFLNSFDILIAQFVRGRERIKIFALSGVLKALILGFCNVIFLLVLQLEAEGYLISIVFSHLSSIFYLSYVGVKMSSFKEVQLDFNLIKRISLFSIPFVPNSISWWINNASDKYIVIYYLGSAATGVYSIANRVPNILVAITTVFNQAWQISAIKKFNKEESSEYYSSIFKNYSATLTAICSILILLSPIIARFLFLNEYYNAWRFVPFLLVAVEMGALTKYYDAIIISTKKTNSIFWATVLGAFINISLNLILIPQIGIMGAAIATMFSYLMIFVFKVVFTKLILENTFVGKETVILIVALIIQAFIQVLLVNYTNLISLAISGFILAITHKGLLSIIKQFIRR